MQMQKPHKVAHWYEVQRLACSSSLRPVLCAAAACEPCAALLAGVACVLVVYYL